VLLIAIASVALYVAATALEAAAYRSFRP